ncbi:hypothetical protein PR048_018479 [Dryococelus australis]|uniref:MADF domain-containing protein n=1 Tax=Dryococelus australis TaxID=614101 RepID=A0ABQ9HCS4_9NEOP|nr:hypothetical protein PR048_018479 [Dryococelus australis]
MLRAEFLTRVQLWTGLGVQHLDEPSPVGYLREHKGIRRASMDKFSECSSFTARTRRASSCPEENLSRLIETCKQYPVLWNPMDGEYYEKPRKQGAWREIAARIGVTDEERKKKMASLLSFLRREKSREKKKHYGKRNR